MTSMEGRRTGQELDMSLTNARQTLALLRSQVQANQIDRSYFVQRLEMLSQLLDDVMAERQGRADASRFAKLYEVSKAIGSSLDLEVVLQRVMDAIITLTQAERGFLMLLNDDGVLEVRIARNFDQESLDSGEVAVSRTITRQVFEQARPIVTTNAAEDPRYAGQASIVANQLRSIMAAPLLARGTTIGVVYVDNRIRTGLFRETDLELLEAFAGQAAVAIENARLFRETDQELARRVEELKTLQWIDRQLNETLDSRKAMDVTVEWAVRLYKARSASLAMINAEDQSLMIMARAGEDDNITHTQEHISHAHPVIMQVIETGEAALHQAEDGHSVLCVPIQRENKVIGVMLVTGNQAEPFDSESQALVTRIVDRAAIAIENARLYNEVKRANEAKSEFIGIVAHELKVPMTSISGYADLIMQFGTLPDRESGFVQRIKNSVVRMQQLVDDLSDISRIESGNLRVEITNVDLKEVIEQAKASVLAQVEERQHVFIEEIDTNLPTVRADPARTVQILINLLSNAYKYTPNGGEIKIKAVPNNGRVYVSIKDTGVGLNEEELRKLGTKFWRSNNDHSLKQRGTGLGFSITRNLIEMMSATLDIQSKPGQGSTFTIGLPTA